MDTILDALQEGRLFELPENDKNGALRFLAHIIEALPHMLPGTDVVEAIMSRESAVSTVLGKGWACPHARVGFEGPLMCVVGWSPEGIEFGSPDGKRVSIIVMYVVPSNQRDRYLKEISILARVLKSAPETERLDTVEALDDARNFLLDLIAAGKETGGPDSRARMIRLQAKPAIAAQPSGDLSGMAIEAVSIVCGPGFKPIALTQNPGILSAVESARDLVERLDSGGGYQNGPWRFVRRSSTAYQGGRVVYDCLALSVRAPEQPPVKQRTP